MLNVITAKFCSGATQAWASEAWQYDYGQVLQFDGIDLPEAYQVHFSNEPMTGETITQIGNADGVSVPDQFFQNGEPIFAWVYLHEGEDDGETVYMVTIPVKQRPQPSDEVPAPVEQSAIDQTIAALNTAVDKADAAIEHYPHIEDGTWWVWDVTEEEWVDTGVAAQGEQGDPGQPGEDGDPGTPGKDGDDGFSPKITVQAITGGHRITITDVNSTQTVDVMDGEDGKPGTPGQPGEPGATGNGIASITKTGAVGLVDTYTITYTNGQTTTFTVTNGSDASVTVDDELDDTSENPVQNKVIAKEITDVKEDLRELSDTVDGKVDDVQINGSSILDGGVANIPLGTMSKPGVVIANGGRGVGVIESGTNQGRLFIDKASLPGIKNGSQETYRPIVPVNQHQATFYGLTKAAGVDMAQSDNPVGQYTDEAKIAIQKMLGIYEAPWELIADVTTSEDLARVIVNTDINGELFKVKKGRAIINAPQTLTGNRDHISFKGIGKVDEIGTDKLITLPTLMWYNATTSCIFYYEFNFNGVSPSRIYGVTFREYGSSQTASSNILNDQPIKYLNSFMAGQYSETHTLIPSGTRIRIYGQRYIDS